MTAEMLEAVVKLGVKVAEVRPDSLNDPETQASLVLSWPGPLSRTERQWNEKGEPIDWQERGGIYLTHHRTDVAGLRAALEAMGIGVPR